MTRFARCAVLHAALTVMLAAACSGGGGDAPPASPVGRIQVVDSTGAPQDHAIGFGTVHLGSSGSASVTITNTGSLDLLLGPIPDANALASPFSISSSGCSEQLLAPAESCTMTVSFTPTSAASSSDSFDVPSGDPDAPVVTVTVTGAGSALPGKVIRVTDDISPFDDASLPFYATGETRMSSQLVRIANAGTDALTLGTIGGSDPLAGAFQLDPGSCTPGKVLTSGQTCLLWVYFTPPEVGSYADTFDIPSDADATPLVSMAVSGTGTFNTSGTLAAFDTAAPRDDRQVAFGNVPVGTKARHVVTFKNIGGTSVTITSLPYNDGLAPPFSIAVNRCSSFVTLGPGQSCAVTIDYAPTSETASADTFDRYAGDGSSWKVSVGGTGGAVDAVATPLPRTGQTACHDATGASIACAGTGLDGELRRGVAWPSPRFVAGADAEAGCITDALTGLTWTKDANLPAAAVTWLGALDWVKAQNAGAGLCGHTDWRLPNVAELRSLVHLGEASVATWLGGAERGFENVQSAAYWTSTTFHTAVTAGYALQVSMAAGAIPYAAKTDTGRVWAVRAGSPAAPAPSLRTGQVTCYGSGAASIPCAGTGQDGELQEGAAWPQTRFLFATDGTVTDLLSGLVWPADPVDALSSCSGPDLTAGRSWQAARDYVTCINAVNYLGHADWRLPNVAELQTLFHAGDASYLGAMLLFDPVYTSTDLWSSDSAAASPSQAWVVNVRLGTQSVTPKTNTLTRVWPVRGG